ncbi:MAG: LysM peptidoglycan-binding domain-containing protein [Desulfamplus sp.]|nr:LysM peptidoglycan-binding domain-containing protein [Desulfamplus sp.]MBF0390867.1 LysM peptidoglycan-binding domain-containing protein [Desulfamplus sp.]
MLKKQGTIRFFFLLIILFLISAVYIQIVSAADINPIKSESKPFNPNAFPVDPLDELSESDAQAVLSTSYKRYSLFKYYDFYILCEPYTVQKGDWIYKIFRSKGDLSKEDFGLFMRVFKTLNPLIKDTNTIKEGQQITIPLKKSRQNDFKESKPGVVDLPIITLTKASSDIPKAASKSEAQEATIKPKLVAEDKKAYVEPEPPKEALSSQLSPSPLPSTPPPPNPVVAKEELPVTAISKPAPKTIPKKSSAIPVRQLKQFAMLNDGRLKLKGKYYFPRNSGDDIVIDVAVTPLIQLTSGSRILFVPDKEQFASFSDTIKKFWHDFKIMEFGEVVPSYYDKKPLTSVSNKLLSASDEQLTEGYIPIPLTVGQDHKSAVKKLLQITGYRYTPEKEIAISVGSVTLRATPGVISRDGKPDILIVFGDIYGSAFEALKKMRKDDIIITISPLLTTIEVAKKLFSALGAKATYNPAFVNPNDGKTISIEGVYIQSENQNKALFITLKAALIKEAFNYLNEKNITIVRAYSPI